MKNQLLLVLLFLLTSTISLAAQNVDTVLARQYLEKGVTFQDSFQLLPALKWIEKATAIYAINPGEQSLVYAKALYHRANALRLLDKGALAQDYCKQAIAIQQAKLDTNHIDLGYSYIVLAKMLSFEAEYDAAKSLIDKVKNIAKNNDDKWFKGEAMKVEAYNTIDPDKHITLLENTFDHFQTHFPDKKIMLGELYYRLGRGYRNYDFEKGVRYSKKALDTFKSVSKNIAYWEGIVLFSLGAGYVDKGKIKEGTQYTTTALEKFQEVLPETHYIPIQCRANLAFVAGYLGDTKKAIQYYKDIIAILKKAGEPNISQYINSYSNLAAYYFDVGDYFNAVVYNQKAIEYAKKDAGATEDLARIYMNLAGAYFNIGGLEEQVQTYLQAAADIIVNCTTRDCQQVQQNLFYNIGTINFNTGNTEKALANTFKSLSINRQLGDSLSIIQDYTNIALGYNDFKQYDLAISYLEKALIVLDNNIPKNDLKRSSIYKVLANVYYSQNAYKESEKYSKLAIDFQKKGAPQDTIGIATLYSNIATLYQTTNKYKLARKYLNKALELKLALYREQSPKLAIILTELAIIDFKQKKWNKAGQNLSKVANLLQVPQRNWQLDLREESYIKYFSSQNVFFNNLFKETQNPKYLDSILLTVDDALAYEGAFVNKLNTNLSKRQFFQYTDEYYITGIEAYFQQAKLHKTTATAALKNLYELSEKNTQKIVRYNLNASEAASFTNFPLAQQQKEQQLLSDITWLEKKIELLPNLESITSDSLRHLQEELATAQLRYFNFVDTIQLHYPEYYQLKYSNDISSLQAVQQTLSPEETMLKYILSDSSAYILGITKDEYIVQSIKKDSLFDFHLETLLQHSRQRIDGITMKKETNATLRQSGYYLYQQLITPMQSLLNKKLIIVPSGQLCQLSFDLLLQSLPDTTTGYKDWAFLLKNHAISYAFSATLFQQQFQRKPSKATLPFFAIAPLFSGSTGIDTATYVQRNLGRLVYNQSEAIEIANLFENNVFFRNNRLLLTHEASLPEFLKYAATAQIIHLSTHGSADDQRGDYCQVIFSQTDSSENGRLYAKDLYGLQLDADLVVLSACETALGEQQNGEGLIGLNQGFTYAGARSIVTSLWQIDDKFTQELMIFFYQNLQEGLSKDEALQQAKLRLLKERNLQPYLWAAFVPYGNMEAMDIEKPWSWTYLLFIVLLTGAVGTSLFGIKEGKRS